MQNVALFSFLFVQVHSFALIASSQARFRQNGIEYGHKYVLSAFNDARNDAEPNIPQLPEIGASSFDQSASRTAQAATPENSNTEQVSEENSKNDVAFVSPKFQLQYTCKICNTRNCHLVSRIGK